MTAVAEYMRIAVPDEATAWQLIDDALHGRLPNEPFQLDIGDWAKLHLKFDGAKFDSTVSPAMMDAFMDLQKNIYRLFAKLHYNDARARILTDEQRRDLEIMVKVEPGSSDLTAILTDAADKITLGLINKLDAKQWVIILLSGILAFTSQSAWKEYLSSQSEAKNVEMQVAMSKEETERLKLVTEAMKQVPHVESIKEDANEFRNKILKSAKTSDRLTVAGQIVEKEQVAKLVRPSRTTSIEVQLNNEYRIMKVDSSDIDHFTVGLMDRAGRTFQAVLQNGTVSKERNMQKLQQAEWERTYIRLEVNGRTLRGQITSATILGIIDPPKNL